MGKRGSKILIQTLERSESPIHSGTSACPGLLERRAGPSDHRTISEEAGIIIGIHITERRPNSRFLDLRATLRTEKSCLDKKV